MEKFFIVVNGLSSKFDRWEEIHYILKKLNLNFEFRITTSVEEAKEIIDWLKNNKFENIVIAGGDGSCNLLINQIANTSSIASFIPLGEGNLLCRELGLESKEIACRILTRKKIEKYDLGLVNNSLYFGCILGIGADGERAYKFSPKRKKGIPITYQEYFLEAISSIINPKEFFYRIETSSGNIYEGKSYQIFIGNIASFFLIEKRNLTGIKRGKDGVLDIVVLKPALQISDSVFAVSPKTFIKALILATRKKETRYYALSSRRESEHYTGENIKIFLSPAQYYHLDGEVLEGPVEKLEIISVSKSILIRYR